MAVAILEDCEQRNIESAPDFFKRIMDPDLQSLCTSLDAKGNIKYLMPPALDAIGIKDFSLGILHLNQYTGVH